MNHHIPRQPPHLLGVDVLADFDRLAAARDEGRAVLLRALGGPAVASALSAFALLAWIFIPLAIAARIREARDV